MKKPICLDESFSSTMESLGDKEFQRATFGILVFVLPMASRFWMKFFSVCKADRL